MAVTKKKAVKTRIKTTPVERATEVLTMFLSKGQLEKFVPLEDAERGSAVTEALRQSKLI